MNEHLQKIQTQFCWTCAEYVQGRTFRYMYDIGGVSGLCSRAIIHKPSESYVCSNRAEYQSPYCITHDHLPSHRDPLAFPQVRSANCLLKVLEPVVRAADG